MPHADIIKNPFLTEITVQLSIASIKQPSLAVLTIEKESLEQA